MIAARQGAIVVASLLMAAMLGLYWSGQTGRDSIAAQSPASQQSATTPKKSHATAIKAEIKEPERPIHTLPNYTPAQTTTNKMDPDEFVAATLKNPGLSILPSTIPALSDTQVDQLAAAYLKIAKPTQKSGILWALGFSQNDRAFDTLQYALTSEYSGAVLSTADNVAQLQVVKLIGALSRTSDRAWQLLVNLVRPNAWERIDVWSEDYLTEQYKSEARSLAQVRSSLQGGAITALGASGRPEFMAWANSLFEGQTDPANFDQRHSNSVSSGVFQATFIAEHGFDDFYDNVMYHTRQGGFAYSRWIQGDEGQRWTKWWENQVTEAVTRDRANTRE